MNKKVRILKAPCPACGALISIKEGLTVYSCESCGTALRLVLLETPQQLLLVRDFDREGDNFEKSCS